MVKRITRPLTMLALAASLGLGALAAQAQPAPGDMPPPPHAMHRGHDFGGFAMQGRLLKEAGAEGLSFELLNRNVDQPFKYLGTWLVDEWSNADLSCRIPFAPVEPIEAYTGCYFRASR